MTLVIKKKLRQIYRLILAPKWCWQIRSNCDVVVYDANNLNILMPYIYPYTYEILHIRGESINLWCMLRSIFSRKFWNGAPIDAYIEAFIKQCSPKVVITFTDNDPKFYSLSRRIQHIKTIFLQNGTRGYIDDVFGHLKPCEQYFVDWMLVHNPAIGKHYGKFVAGKILPLGSLKNNAIPVSHTKKAGILFISQYQSKPADGDILAFEPGGQPIYWERFYSTDKLALSTLKRWCIQNRKTLKICGREGGNGEEEREFFKHELDGCEWSFVRRSLVSGAYALIDSAEIVVTIDSTLGYESIGRGNKTAILSCRVTSDLKPYLPFAWPSIFPNNGPFWTNELDECQFERVLNNLLIMTDDDWESVSGIYKNELMVYDKGNSLLVTLLDRLIPKFSLK